VTGWIGVEEIPKNVPNIKLEKFQNRGEDLSYHM
jgi:hypothetical protein